MHHWKIATEAVNHRYVGVCKHCGEVKDFPTDPIPILMNSEQANDNVARKEYLQDWGKRLYNNT